MFMSYIQCIYIYISYDYVYMYDPSCMMTINVGNKRMYIMHVYECILYIYIRMLL